MGAENRDEEPRELREPREMSVRRDAQEAGLGQLLRLRLPSCDAVCIQSLHHSFHPIAVATKACGKLSD
jgi:hypothetical protein